MSPTTVHNIAHAILGVNAFLLAVLIFHFLTGVLNLGQVAKVTYTLKVAWYYLVLYAVPTLWAQLYFFGVFG